MRRYITTTVLVFGAVEPQDIAALQRRCGIMRLYITTTVLVFGAVEPQDIAALHHDNRFGFWGRGAARYCGSTTHYPLPTTHYPLTPPTTHKPKPTARKLAVQNTPPSMEFIYFCGLPEPKIGIVLGMIV